MWCKKCNIETNGKICPVCGCETVEDLPVEIYWCNDCAIPVIHTSNAADKGTCPVCAGKTHYLTSDLRPVFPEERLLLAVLLDKELKRQEAYLRVKFVRYLVAVKETVHMLKQKIKSQFYN